MTAALIAAAKEAIPLLEFQRGRDVRVDRVIKLLYDAVEAAERERPQMTLLEIASARRAIEEDRANLDLCLRTLDELTRLLPSET